MKTKTIHSIALAVLVFLATVNLWTDHLDRKNLKSYQLQAMWNQWEISGTLLSYPNIVEAVEDNRTVNVEMFKARTADHKLLMLLKERQDDLIEHTNFVIDERNAEFLEKLRAAKPCDFSINGSPFDKGCLPTPLPPGFSKPQMFPTL